MSSAVRRGDIRNADYAWKAKTYSWSVISECFPSGISPTDIDGTVERGGNFLIVEFKTLGTTIGRGQMLYFEQFLYSLKERAHIFVLEHAPLENVDVSDHIERMSIWWWDTTQHAVAKLNTFSSCKPKLMWWFEQWTLHADGRSNDLIRTLREAIGIYPPSQSRPVKFVGGKTVTPPFKLNPDNSQVTFFRNQQNSACPSV